MNRFDCPICYISYRITDGIIYCNNFVGKEETQRHGICVDCIRNLAKAAVGDAPIAKGGIGLPCPSCDNVILIGMLSSTITIFYKDYREFRLLSGSRYLSCSYETSTARIYYRSWL